MDVSATAAVWCLAHHPPYRLDTKLSRRTSQNSCSRETVSGKCWANLMVAYAQHYSEQQIPYGSLRRPVALHPPASLPGPTGQGRPRLHGLRTDPRCRLLLRALKSSSALLAVAPKGLLPAMEDPLRLVQQKMAHRWDLRAPERSAARAPAGTTIGHKTRSPAAQA